MVLSDLACVLAVGLSATACSGSSETTRSLGLDDGTGGGNQSSDAGDGAAGAAGALLGDGSAGSLLVSADDAQEATTLPDGGEVCKVLTFSLTRTPVDIVIVLDRSGSMRRTVDGNVPTAAQKDKWSEVTEAINQTIAATQADIFWGLEMFPMPPVEESYSDPAYTTDVRKCEGDKPPQVAPALQAATDIATALGGAVPMLDTGATPTAAATTTAVSFLSGLSDKNPKYLLLATDGVPNCMGGSDTTPDTQGAIDAVTSAAGAGFPVFVVGIAPSGSVANDTLNSMATAGAMPATGGTTTYYSVRSGAELVATLGTITGQAASCALTFDTAPPDPTNVAVDLAGEYIEKDEANGWTYGDTEMKSIVLHGTACEKLKTVSAKDAVIKFGCPGQPPPR
jgi:Mg-chelatase subunit ChlD